MKADCTLMSLKRGFIHLYQQILQATCSIQTGTWCYRVRGQSELENLYKNQICLQPMVRSCSHQSNITTYKQHRRCLMGDQFLLCTLYPKHTHYTTINTMYHSNARDPTTTTGMQNRGMLSGLFQCLQFRSHVSQKKRWWWWAVFGKSFQMKF